MHFRAMKKHSDLSFSKPSIMNTSPIMLIERNGLGWGERIKMVIVHDFTNMHTHMHEQKFFNPPEGKVEGHYATAVLL